MQKSGSLLFAARPGVTLVLVVMLLVLLQVAVMGTVTSSARQVDLMTVGYQGVSSRSISHRQSGACASMIHVGRPKAAERCPTEVSTVITWSKLLNNAIVSS